MNVSLLMPKLAVLVPWIISHGYFIFFIAALIEGPFVTIAAGVATSLGYFNFFLATLVAIAGDLAADTIYYFIGYHSRNLIIERYGHFIGLNKELMERISNSVNKHFKKTMLVLKISPFIPIPGLISIGASRVSLKKFITVSLLITAPKSLFFILLGFYSGKTYNYLQGTVTNGFYIIGGLVLIIILIYIIYRKIAGNISKNSGIE